MTKLLSALVLVAALSGSVTAGVPMHASMNDAMMDCCKTALAHNDSSATSAARLFCAMNCQEPGPTSGAVIQTGSTWIALPVAVIPHSDVRDSKSCSGTDFVLPHRSNFQPSYIFNLALLI